MIKSKSGRKYIHSIKNGKLQWRVTIWNNEHQKAHYVGSYYDIEDAVRARNEYCACQGIGTLRPTD
jgi:hypothetical protein